MRSFVSPSSARKIASVCGVLFLGGVAITAAQAATPGGQCEAPWESTRVFSELVAQQQDRIAELELIVQHLTDDSSFRETLAQAPRPCASLSDRLRDSLGVRCRTSKGRTFERVVSGDFGKAWRDDRGWLYSELLDGRPQSEVEVSCRAIGGQPLSPLQFQIAENRGIREVMPEMIGGWIWTSATVTGNPVRDREAWAFHATDRTGTMEKGLRTHTNRILCVRVPGSDSLGK